jgi:hypothetical protein
MQEIGAGPAKVPGAMGGKVEILKMKQTGARCTVKKGGS